MPKLSKSRIINLNYNDGKRTIYDEIFDYGQGKDTLFSMENGIGKTVLIQFFLQPFIRNKRELAGRNFEDYFTGTAPTYILHEILLENGEKLLVGMVIKKEASEEEKNKLRILTFLNRYSKPNDFDLVNAPFVDGKRILKFSEAEEKIKKYKSGKMHFKYYNFNDSSKKREYFEDLKTYKLNYKEWEDIIRIINNDESGLSNLYDKHKTDEALVRNVIVPLIESKINGEKNIIEVTKNNLSRYIESYKEYKESFEEIRLLKSFIYEMAPILEELKQGAIKEEEEQRLLRRLSYIGEVGKEELSRKVNEKLQLEDFIQELNRELRRVSYEEHSLNFYNLQGEQQVLEEKLQVLRDNHNNKNTKNESLTKEKFIQEGAEVYEELIDLERHLAEVRERIANLEREDSDIAQNIRNYKFSLKGIYSEELQQLDQKESQLLKEKENINKKLKENEENSKEIAQRTTENIIAITKAESVIQSFESYEEGFRKKYKDFNFFRNPLLKEYNGKELENFSTSIDSNITSNLALQENLKKEEASLKEKKEKLKNISLDLNQELRLNREAFSTKNNDLSNFNKETNKIVDILRIKNLPLKVVEQKQKLEDLIQNENLKLEDNLNREQRNLREVEATLHRYQTGLIELPKEVLESFENKGISFEYGLNWLQNYKGSREEKEALIEENPFFPYGILLSHKDITLLKKESIDVYTSIPIPIINKSHLNNPLKLEKNYDVLTLENAEFLLSFNRLLIHEEERILLIKNLENQGELLKEEIKKIKNAIDRNTAYLLVLNNYPYEGNEHVVLEEEIRLINETINTLEDQLKTNAQVLENCETREGEITKELSTLEKNLKYLEDEKLHYTEFKEKYLDFVKSNGEVEALKREGENLERKAQKLKTEFLEFHSTIKDIDINLINLKRSIKEISSKLELYKNVEEGTVLKEDKNILEGKLQSCEKQLGDNISRDKEQEKNLLQAIDKSNTRLKRIKNDGALSREYMEATFSEEKLEEIKLSIKALEGELKELSDEINKLDKAIDRIDGKKSVELRDIEKLGYSSPLSKEEIGDISFRAREKAIREDLKENDNLIKDYGKVIEKLNTLNQTLSLYKSNYNFEEQEDFDFKDLEAAIKTIDSYIGSYNRLSSEVQGYESKISIAINKIYEAYRDKNRLIKERIFVFQSKESKVSALSEIEYFLETLNRKISTLELEVQHIKSEEEVVINDILRYANHLLSDLRTIDKKSSIKHLGKTQKLLEISIPEDTEEENLKEYIKDKVNFYSTLEDYKTLLDSDIQSAELLSKLIGNLNRVRVDIKKIEKTGLTRKSWKEVLSQNSGGEKFVSMFILLSSLMSYMRKRETDIDNREDKKIIIMDNPFAKTNAEHLLEPMFQIAEKYNIQLLCFSGIGGSSVYNRFDKIYVAKVVGDRFRNKENVSFKAGTEETLELSDFTIGKEQISLF